MSAQHADVDVRPVTPSRWADLVRLFEGRGPRGGRQPTANCWCVVWRAPSRTPQANRHVLAGLVHAGEEPGLLAYRDDEPVGWVSVAPQEQFTSLLRSPQLRPDDGDDGMFVISCFAVARQQRRQGIATALLAAAVDHARSRGASAVQAYPGEQPDYKGRLEWFLDGGFAPVRTAGKRTVVRLSLR
jgi:GNAT superfamily N-acetyltransferase